ncbi:hypothetical protein JOB18_004585 [Solea senegalensis]|uniref:Uncharacterized protein n=2 Tax=Solea senegalensis TaxID=28829 RepID=A0AAV6QML6_SOLSE|nr:uncharacterized protein LOC122767672 [Solea senegalensis]KAG7493260.1 hypothetical protein JOB18_004585 [Solea senegalensis]
MSTSKMLTFRSFLTERFTSVAVEIFEEVGNIVEEFHQENIRLRNILHMVLSPEIKLTHIDFSKQTSANRRSEVTTVAAEEREQPPELNTGVDWEISEPLPKMPKEEQIEYDISFNSEPIQEQGGSDSTVTPVWVKNEPEQEDEDMDAEPEMFTVQDLETIRDSSDTASADMSYKHDDSSLSNLGEVSEYSQLPSNEDGGSGSLESQITDSPKEKRILKTGLQKTLLEEPRSMPTTSIVTALPDYNLFLARLTEVYKDFPDDEKPLITTMGLTANVKMVDCAFGKVPVGSPLSYQCPVPSGQDYKPHKDAPHQPSLPLPYNRLDPEYISCTLTLLEQEILKNMRVTWEAANRLAYSTCESEFVEELRKLRLTCRFREICKLKPEGGEVEQLISKIRKGPPMYKMALIDRETKSEVLREYCRRLCISWYPCGLVVHPNAPWLGALPDGLAYDPQEKHSFGLVHVKCIGLRSFVNCGFLVCWGGVMKLQTTHECYWHIQGEMMVTGASWCDLLVWSKEDLIVQRIYRDKGVIEVMKKKLPDFFFRYYLQTLLPQLDATA